MELVKTLLLSNLFNVHVVTTVSASFFQASLKDSLTTGNPTAVYTYHNRMLDSGAIQLDALRVDPTESLRKYYLNIHTRRDYLLQKEVEFLQDEKIDLVVADATPLGCAAGKAAGIATVLLTNFSWDYCFREMLQKSYVREKLLRDESLVASEDGERGLETLSDLENMVNQCAKDSFSCGYYIQLPGQTPCPSPITFKAIEGPLIARIASINARETIRMRLGITSEQKVLLLGFGGHNAEWNIADSFLPSDWVCLILGISADKLLDLQLPEKRFIPMSFNTFVPDLIAASDVVLGKIGYGFVSECIANGTPLVYVPRSDWPEEPFVGE